MQPICLENANINRHNRIVSQVEDAIERLLAQSKNVSFYSVAKEAGVARSTLYRVDELRKLVEEARSHKANGMTQPPSKTQLLQRVAELEFKLACAQQMVEEMRDAGQFDATQYEIVQLESVA